MRVNTMRHIDRFLGVPLCWVTGLMSGLGHGETKNVDPGNIHTILVIKFFGLGSVLLTSPALHMMRVYFPSARIIYLTFETNRELLERLECLDEILTIRTGHFSTFVRDTAAVVAKLNHLHVNIVFDFEFFSKFSTLLSALSRAPIRAGFSLPARWRKKIVTHPVPLDKAIHVSETFCNQVFSLGATHRSPELAVPRIHEDDVRKLKKKIPIRNEPFVTINVNAGHTFLERRWAPSRFAKLVDALAEQEHRPFIFTGTEDERDYVEAAIQLSKYRERCFNAAGMLNLGELLALLKQSTMLISNDSGPLHLAASLGTPTIGLFGPESPRFYGQRNHRSHSIYKSVPCSPCMNIYDAKTFRCPYNAKCMEAITVHEVRLAAETLYTPV